MKIDHEFKELPTIGPLSKHQFQVGVLYRADKEAKPWFACLSKNAKYVIHFHNDGDVFVSPYIEFEGVKIYYKTDLVLKLQNE